LDARIGDVVAILGCDDAQHREVIADLPVDVRVNDEWAEGLAATLRSAVRAAKERQAALLVLPCDQATLVKAGAIGVPENVAVLDDGGNLKAFARMDGAPILSIEISLHKAYTALFGLATHDFFKFIQTDPSLLG